MNAVDLEPSRYNHFGTGVSGKMGFIGNSCSDQQDSQIILHSRVPHHPGITGGDVGETARLGVVEGPSRLTHAWHARTRVIVSLKKGRKGGTWIIE
jgi:hypothetical protein